MKKGEDVTPTLGSEGRTWFCLDCKTLVKGGIALIRSGRHGDCECDLRLPEGQTTLEVVKE